MAKQVIHIEERLLLQKLRKGDVYAFEQIYHLYKRRIAGNLLRLVKSEEMVEELLQDLFLKVWIHRARIDSDQPLRAYLFRISENMVYDIFRTAARDKKMRERLAYTQSELYTHIEEVIFNEEQSELLERAISLLPPRRQQIFRLSKMEGKSYEEISEGLNISKSTVNDHLLKANRFLRDYISTNKSLVALLIWCMSRGI